MTEYILIGSSLLCSIAVLAVLLRMNAMGKEMQELRRENQALRRENQEMIQQSFHVFGEMISTNQKTTAENLDQRLFELNTRFSHMAVENEQKLENIRGTIEKKITDLTEDNNRQLSEMRQTVDEKQQKTLEDRISQSFQLVSQRLEQVYRGLGEMQTLASGVGDLKKVLSGVKTRGNWGEMQLSALLQQLMAPGQYDENVAVVPGSAERVEFALRLPGRDGEVTFLPIDSKFPQEDYLRLTEASQAADRDAVEEARKALAQRMKAEARRISSKYIAPPHTTDFAVMFLPVEGLYAEVVQIPGLTEGIQREYRVVAAGPSTFAALLNALQMGFRTLAIEQRSGEVWKLLGQVKSDFGKFADTLDKTRQKLQQASESIDTAFTRTRAIQKRLGAVETLDSGTEEDA